MKLRHLIFSTLFIFALSVGAFGQALAPGNWSAAAGGTNPLPAASLNGNKVFNVTDGVRPGDCVTGGATGLAAYKTPCISNGTIYIPWVDSRGDPMFIDANYASLSAAVTAIGSTVGELAISTASWPDGANVTVPSTLRLRFVNAGTLNQTNVVTINGGVSAPPGATVFVGNGTIILNPTLTPIVYAAWWAERTVTVPAPTSAPTLSAQSNFGFGGNLTNSTTYQVAYTYAAWNGETGLSPVTSFVAKNSQSFAVMPFASLANNSKYADAVYVYISADGGSTWHRATTNGYFSPGGQISPANDPGWGGALVSYEPTGAAPPTAGTTTTTFGGNTVPVPTVAPTVTNIHANAAATYYAAFAYLCGDGTESALSSVSSGFVASAGAGIIAQLNNEPPSGAVAIRLYVGTSATPSAMHLQATYPLSYAVPEIQDYTTGGAAPSAGTAQSVVSNLQLAYDALMESGKQAKIIVGAGPTQLKSPFIARLKNSAGTQIKGMQIEGIGAMNQDNNAAGRLDYVGTVSTAVVGVLVSTSGLDWNGLSIADPNSRLTAALAVCDYVGGGGFYFRPSHSSFTANKAGSVGLSIPIYAGASHTPSEMHVTDCQFTGDAWGAHIHNAQTGDLLFKGCGFGTNGNSNSKNSGGIYMAAGFQIQFDGIEIGGAAGGYPIFFAGDDPHPRRNNRTNVLLRNVFTDASSAWVHKLYISGNGNGNQLTIDGGFFGSSISDGMGLYVAQASNVIISNTRGGGQLWVNWIDKQDAGPTSATDMTVTEIGGDSFFGRNAGVKISSTSDVGSQVNKAVLANININGYRLSNDGKAATTPAQITSNQNDYHPVGTAYLQRWSSDASRDVTGLDLSYNAGGTTPHWNGEQHEIWNVGSQNIVLKNESASSGAANRFTISTGSDLTLGPNRMAKIFYDGITSRWRVSAETAGGGGGTVTSVFGRTGAVVAATNDYTLAQVAPTLGSDATGDLYYRNSGGTFSRLPIGSADGKILQVLSGLPAWSADVVVDPVQVFNAQTGTSYTIVSGDNTKFLTLNNGSAIAVSLPQATGSFTTGWTIDIGAIGAGTVTVTPTTSTIDATRVGGTGAQTTLTITTGKSVRLVSNGTNYIAYNYQGRF